LSASGSQPPLALRYSTSIVAPSLPLLRSRVGQRADRVPSSDQAAPRVERARSLEEYDGALDLPGKGLVSVKSVSFF
jgi:hypothetical protein